MSNPAMQAFDPIPSIRRQVSVTVAPDLSGAVKAGAVAVPVDATNKDAQVAGFDREALSGAGFDGRRGQTLVIPSAGEQVFVAVLDPLVIAAPDEVADEVREGIGTGRSTW